MCALLSFQFAIDLLSCSFSIIALLLRNFRNYEISKIKGDKFWCILGGSFRIIKFENVIKGRSFKTVLKLLNKMNSVNILMQTIEFKAQLQNEIIMQINLHYLNLSDLSF